METQVTSWYPSLCHFRVEIMFLLTFHKYALAYIQVGWPLWSYWLALVFLWCCFCCPWYLAFGRVRICGVSSTGMLLFTDTGRIIRQINKFNWNFIEQFQLKVLVKCDYFYFVDARKWNVSWSEIIFNWRNSRSGPISSFCLNRYFETWS